MNTCGGCAGQGSHRRWCMKTVGTTAAVFGRASEACEDIADSIGSNDMQAANTLYATAARLRARAREATAIYRARTTTIPAATGDTNT